MIHTAIEAIQEELIAWARDAYVRGDAEVDYFEGIVDAVLHGRSVTILQPGERVLTTRRRRHHRPCIDPQCKANRVG